MTKFQERALARVALTAETVQSFYDGTRSGTAEECLKALCVSHERLRHELEGAEILLKEQQEEAAKIVQQSIDAFIENHEMRERAERTKRIKESLECAKRIAGMPERVVNLIQDLMRNHEAIGRETTVYSEAAAIVEQVQTALEVTMESRGIIIKELEATKLKLKVANAKIHAFQSVGCSAYIEGWKEGNQFMALHPDERDDSAQRCWRESKALQEITSMEQ